MCLGETSSRDSMVFNANGVASRTSSGSSSRSYAAVFSARAFPSESTARFLIEHVRLARASTATASRARSKERGAIAFPAGERILAASAGMTVGCRMRPSAPACDS